VLEGKGKEKEPKKWEKGLLQLPKPKEKFLRVPSPELGRRSTMAIEEDDQINEHQLVPGIYTYMVGGGTPSTVSAYASPIVVSL
jgi:hypothetical protein